LLHYLRSQKQWLGLTIVPLLLMVWLSLSCQNCFAAKIEMTAACDHQASMECCTPVHKQDKSGPVKCDTYHVVSQAVIADDVVLHVNDHVLPDMVASRLASFPDPVPSEYRYSRVKAFHFTHPIFKHYRVLLI